MTEVNNALRFLSVAALEIVASVKLGVSGSALVLEQPHNALVAVMRCVAELMP